MVEPAFRTHHRLTWAGRAQGLRLPQGLWLQRCGLPLQEAGVRGLGLFSGLHVSEGTCRHSPRGVVRRCPAQCAPPRGRPPARSPHSPEPGGMGRVSARRGQKPRGGGQPLRGSVRAPQVVTCDPHLCINPNPCTSSNAWGPLRRSLCRPHSPPPPGFRSQPPARPRRSTRASSGQGPRGLQAHSWGLPRAQCTSTAPEGKHLWGLCTAGACSQDPSSRKPPRTGSEVWEPAEGGEQAVTRLEGLMGHRWAHRCWQWRRAGPGHSSLRTPVGPLWSLIRPTHLCPPAGLQIPALHMRAHRSQRPQDTSELELQKEAAVEARLPGLGSDHTEPAPG